MNIRLAMVAGAIALLLTLAPASAEEPRLLDANGAVVTQDDFGPQYRLLYFGYTHCPDACPLGLQNMSDALDRLGRIGDAITPVFISVDPERDKPDVMKRYAEMFHPRLKVVTGDAAAIAALAELYKVTYTRVDLGPGRPYAVDHTTSIYLTDKTGRVLGRFPHTISAAELAQKIAGRIAQD